MPGDILLVGCGKMGGALLDGWLDQGIAASDIHVVEPESAAVQAAHRTGVVIVASADALPPSHQPAIVVFAVKPQAMDDVVPAYAPFAETGATILSIAAGPPISYFEGNLGANAAVVRAMPNTPAAVRHGMTVLCANPNVTQSGRQLCTDLLGAVGEVAWIDNETLMDPVTAVSGSGPAYVFLLAECLAEAGVSAGLPRDLADQLARTTVAGSGELLRRSPDTATRLRENVTSPGGTTEAALGVLMATGGVPDLMQAAVAAATERSRELAG